MRIVYMDEAGISKPSQEPYLIVAAGITDPDRQWHDIRRHYDDLATEFFDEEMEYGFVFHAKQVWHGEPPFDRTKYDRRQRLRLLRRLAQVPRLHEVPICLGIIDKGKFNQKNSEMPPKQRRAISHALAFHLALQAVDWWMEEHCSGEVAMIVAEDTPEVKSAIHLFHQGAQSDPLQTDHEDSAFFQSRCIVDSVNFAPKAQSPILQIADTCAFLVRRRLAGCQICRDLCKELWPMVIIPRSRTREVVLKIPIESLRLALDRTE